MTHSLLGLKVSAYIALPVLLLVAIAIETLSVIELATYPYFPDRSLVFAKTDATIFAVLAPLSPALLILLLYLWIPEVASALDSRVSAGLRSFLNFLGRAPYFLRSKASSVSTTRFPLTDRPRLLLAIAIIAAMLLAVVPYRPSFNPAQTPVGVDSHYYVDWTNQMLLRTPGDAFVYALGSASYGSRPLILLPIYALVSTGAVPVAQAVEFLPVVLGPMVAVSTFILVREGRRDERTAGLASLFSTFSVYTTVGIWAGFFASWLAIVEANIFLALSLSFLRSASKTRFAALTLLSVSMLLTHPWTGVMVLAVATVFVFSAWKGSPNAFLARSAVLLPTISIAVYVAKSIFVEGLATAQFTEAGLSGSGTGVSQLVSFWPNIVTTLFSFFDGLLGNAVMLGISLIAVIRLRFSDMFERLLIIWVAIASLAFPFVASGYQARIIYDLPLPILTSLGVLIVTRPAGNWTTISALTVLLVLLLSANYALRAVTNLVAAPLL